MGLSVLRMADGLVTLVDERNLKGASLLVRKVFGFWVWVYLSLFVHFKFSLSFILFQ